VRHRSRSDVRRRGPRRALTAGDPDRDPDPDPDRDRDRDRDRDLDPSPGAGDLALVASC
jgi:hypothetical protein